MSGFAVTRGRDADHTFLRRRGPDRTERVEAEGYRFVHHLLCTGRETGTQPLVDGNVVAVLDGALHGMEDGDLLALYREDGEDFVRRLDGEFALALYDFERRILLLATDAFATKPLFVRGTEAASYRSALGGGERMAPNTLAVVDLEEGGEIRREVVAPFDFDRQHKESYDDWLAAFERAVEKRACDGCYVPLSAGYDSGGIDCALRQLGVDFKGYSIAGLENPDLLRQRGGEMLRMDDGVFAERDAFLRAHAEAATFHVRIFTGEEEDYEVHEDRASRGLALVHARAAEEGRRVFLSGSGADEILAACRHWPGTRFPEELRPWLDFDGNWQTAYLAKEENVAGSLGVEGRYPFLDRDVVQEFLWLDAELKSRRYKAPLHEYMARCGYPFDEGVKTGFNPLRLQDADEDADA